MSTIRDLMRVTGVAVDIAHLKTSRDMLKLEQEKVMSEAELKALRDAVYNYRKLAERISTDGSCNPAQKAAAIHWLGLELGNCGLTADRFREIADKEYVDELLGYTAGQFHALIKGLPEPEVLTIEDTAQAACRINDYGYYLSCYERVVAYDRAVQILRRQYFSQYLEYPVVRTLAWLALPGIALMTFGIGGYFWWKFVRSLCDAVDVVSGCNDIDFGRMSELDSEFKGDINLIRKLSDEARAKVASMFGSVRIYLPLIDSQP